LASERTNLAVLFADVSGSTHLYEQMGDTAAFNQINDCIGIFTAAAKTFGGWVSQSIGDGLICVFPNADAAALAACHMQGRLNERLAQTGKVKLTARIGFHFGPVVRTGDEVYGETVRLANQIAALGTASHIAVSASTAALLSAHLNLRVRKLDSMLARSGQRDLEIHEIAWQDSDTETDLSGRTAMAARLLEPRLTLEYHGQSRVFHQTLLIGRGETNDLVLEDPMTSRHHARIERRNDNFVLVDQSTNGTFVTVQGERETPLRRSEFILYGHGEIAFGDSPSVRPDIAVIRFSCEATAKNPAA